MLIVGAEATALAHGPEATAMNLRADATALAHAPEGRLLSRSFALRLQLWLMDLRLQS